MKKIKDRTANVIWQCAYSKKWFTDKETAYLVLAPIGFEANGTQGVRAQMAPIMVCKQALDDLGIEDKEPIHLHQATPQEAAMIQKGTNDVR